MKVRQAGERPYRTKKYMLAIRALRDHHGHTAAETADRTWCYQRLAQLRWRWNPSKRIWYQLT